MTKSFGAAKVELVHPSSCCHSPGCIATRDMRWDLSSVVRSDVLRDPDCAHIELRQLAKRDGRNVVLVIRYVLNHPEPLVLLALLLFAGARLRLRETRFWWPAVGLGLAMWGIYGLVNVEERYVTVAYFAVLLPLFAALEVRAESESRQGGLLPANALRSGAAVLVVLLAFLALGETLRVALQERREQSVAGFAHGWQDPEIFGAAEGLRAMGVQPGEEIACVGTRACLDDHYWARLAGVQILTEMYEPEPKHLIDQLGALPNPVTKAYEVARAQGAKVLVGRFDPGEMNAAHPASARWVRLGETAFYALPLNVPGEGSR